MNDTSSISRPEAVSSGDTKLVARKRPRILLVEGDGFTRLVLLLHLRLAGFRVDFTSNGILGLGKLRSCCPDVLLVELKLCGMSGLELIKAARAEPTFGKRPVYVFTHVERMSRAMRKEIRLLAAELFDKGSVTREALVQNFAAEFLNWNPSEDQSLAGTGPEPATGTPNEMLVPGMIEDIITGVRDQSELLARCSETGDRAASIGELLSRVSSLAGCAEAAGLLNLARHAKALENYLSQLSRKKQACSDAALSTIRPAIEVMTRTSLDVAGKEQKLSRFSAVVVDEARKSNQALKAALLNAGFKPVCFDDPPRGREYLASNRTDLIIINVVLPEGHSLALADIRRLPPHAKTPVIFGAESSASASLGDELPPVASRLDIETVLLSELVVQALNQVQSKVDPNPVGQAARPPAPRAERQFDFRPDVNAVASLSSEEDMESFARSLPHNEASEILAPAQSPSAPAEAIHELDESRTLETTIQAVPAQSMAAPVESEQPDDCLSPSGDILNEPVVWAEPGAADADPAADSPARLPSEAPIDGSQMDERPVEELLFSHLLEEAPQPPQPELTAEGQSDAAARLAAAGETNQPVPAIDAASEFDQDEAAAVQELAAATPNQEQTMNHQLQTSPATYAPHDQVAQPGLIQNERDNQREDLAARLYAADVALYNAQAQIERRDKIIEALQKQLAEVAQGGSLSDTHAEATAAEQKAQARCVELEQEVAALRQAFEDFNASVGQEQQAALEASSHARELEERLNQNAAELEKQKEDRQRAEAEWCGEREAASFVSRQSEAARQQAEARCAQLEQEMGSLRQSWDELAGRLAQEQKANGDSAERLKKLEAELHERESETGAAAGDPEQQVRQGVAALARATAELAKERGERQRSDQRAAELNERLQELHEELRRTLQAQREDRTRISALEEQDRQTRQTLEERTAEREQLQDEFRLAEEQLQKAKEVNAQLRKDLSFFEEANKKFDGARLDLQTRLEANLNAARENEARLQQESSERQRLTESLESTRRELQDQLRRRETLEQQLEAVQDALQDRDAKLRQETAERQRLKEAQDSFQRSLRDNSERDLEVSKLQSALHHEQVERARQEAQLARMRRSALEAARAARSLRTSLRRQIREPVDNLVHSARSLLELETGEEQRKLAEAFLQDVLLVQTRLREPEPTHDETAGTAEPTIPTEE